MTWYLIFASIAVASASGPPHTQAYIAGPYKTKMECEKHERLVDKHWCLVGCLYGWHLTETIAELE
jgi:hypothetical protein